MSPTTAGTDSPCLRPFRPEHCAGKRLHADYRTASVLVTVLMSVTVLPFILIILGGVVNELTGTQWPGILLILLLSLPLLGFSVSLLLGLVRRGYVLVLDDHGVTYSESKKPTKPIAWANITSVKDKLTPDKTDARSAYFKVTYRQVQQDGSVREKSLRINQSLLDVDREQIREVFEDRIGPLDGVEQAQPDSFGSKLGRGVVITIATSVTDTIKK